MSSWPSVGHPRRRQRWRSRAPSVMPPARSPSGGFPFSGRWSSEASRSPARSRPVGCPRVSRVARRARRWGRSARGNVGGLTDVAGLLVGHAADLVGLTGCTAVLCPAGAVAAVEVRGGASGLLGLDLLDPGHLVTRVHGAVLAGGSAFGLEACFGVMAHLESRGIGLPTTGGPVPLVLGAILYDLAVGARGVRPDRAMGAAAAAAASTGPVPEGSVGAGAGASVGKAFGQSRAMKGG